MIKPDVITCHPRDIYYPYWVKLMNKNRHLFNRIIVVFTQSATDRDYRNPVKNSVLDVSWVDDYTDDGKDWRNSAINAGLILNSSPHTLFLEQDFLVKDGFFEKVFDIAEEHPIIGFREGNRLHPAFLLIEKPVIHETTMNFGRNEEGDHFHPLTAELDSMMEVTELKDLAVPEWLHLAGITHNYRLNDNWYLPEEFYQYNHYCQNYSQPSSWKQFSIDIEKKLEEKQIKKKSTLKPYFCQ